jgi:Spy/CpxP family protein refolding chaperone
MIFRLLLAAALTAALATAQRGGGGGGGDEGGGRGGDMAPTLSRQPPNKMERIEAMLKLNKEQRKQVKSVFDDAQKQAAPLRDQMIKGRMAIAGAIQAGKTEDEVRQAVNSFAALESQMASIEMNAFAKVYKTIDPDQRKAASPVFAMMPGLFRNKNWMED